MTTDKTGGPAFPCMPPQDTAAGCAVGYPFPDQGMTLRDYFAAKAMAELVGPLLEGSDHPLFERVVAAQAYMLADAMLTTRKEGGKK